MDIDYGFYDVEEQKKRRQKVKDLLIPAVLSKFNNQGEWIAENPLMGGIGALQKIDFVYICLSCSSQDNVQKANAILASAFPLVNDHFIVNAALKILLHYSGKLMPDNLEYLRHYAANNEQLLDKNLDFLGYNDNFPALGTFAAIVCGEMFDRTEMLDMGMKRLKQLEKLLTRKGFLSEFTSPDYISMTVHCLADIYNCAKNAEARKMALDCEHRVWFEILSHYHEETSSLAGPYSRAYTVDSVAHASNVNASLFAVLGERVYKNPCENLFPFIEGEYHHGITEYMQIGQCYEMDVDYHCPSYLVEELINKRAYPYRVLGTVEIGPSRIDSSKNFSGAIDHHDIYQYPAGSGIIHTYMTANYAIGSASHEFIDIGMTDSPHILYRKSKTAASIKDTATVYTRYIVNESKPGQMNPVHGLEKEELHTLLRDAGRKTAMQHDNTVMVIYKPKLYSRSSISSLKMSLIIPSFYSDVEELWAGSQLVKDLNYSEYEKPETVFVKDGPVYMAFTPLINTQLERKAALKIEKYNGFLMVSFYNYEGPPRDFDELDILLTGNGCVIEVRDESEAGSFEQFKAMVLEARLEDELDACRHSRGAFTRKIGYFREGLDLEFLYAPVSEGIQYATVNGKERKQPMLEVSGFDISKLPYV